MCVCVCVGWLGVRSGLLLCEGNSKVYNPVRGKGAGEVFSPQPNSRLAHRSLNPPLLFHLPPCSLDPPPPPPTHTHTNTHTHTHTQTPPPTTPPSATSPPPLQPPVGGDYWGENIWGQQINNSLKDVQSISTPSLFHYIYILYGKGPMGSVGSC